jgi:hypothetical protein
LRERTDQRECFVGCYPAQQGKGKHDRVAEPVIQDFHDFLMLYPGFFLEVAIQTECPENVILPLNLLSGIEDIQLPASVVIADFLSYQMFITTSLSGHPC